MIRRSGRELYGGIKYEYSVSRQGLDHCVHILDTPPKSTAEELISNPNYLPPITGDPIIDPTAWKWITRDMPPHVKNMTTLYEKLMAQRGGRFNRFRVSKDKKRLIAFCIFSAPALGDRFKDVLLRTEQFMAIDSFRDDIHRSRILDALHGHDKDERVIRVTEALIERLFLLNKLKITSASLLPKDAYRILEVEKILRSAFFI
jgi:hypothetical protein